MKLPQIRKRTGWLVGGSLLVLLYSFVSDPNGGALTVAFLGQLATPIIAVWFAYLARKALFDYVDVEEIYRTAKGSTVGAGLIFIGLCIVFFGLLSLFGNQLHAQTIPEQAKTYLPTLRQEQERIWPNHPKLTYLQDLSNKSLAYPSLTQSVGIPKVD